MKVKDGLIIKEIDNEYVLIDSGIVPPIFNGIVKLNKTSKDIIDILLEKECSFDELIENLLEKYDASKEELVSSITPFLDELRRIKLLYE